MEKMTIVEAAEILKKIFRKPFGGKKKNTRYQITRKDLLKLIGRKTIGDLEINRLRKELHQLGYIFIDIGDEFAVLEEGPLHNYRKVTKKIFEYLATKDKVEEIKPKRKLVRLKIKKTIKNK